MKFRLAARCVFCFDPDADCFLGLSGCGMYHFILVPMRGCVICEKIPSGAVSSGLCIGVCGLSAPGWRLCRHKDRFVL